jgi:hypothetical protein
MVDPRINMHLLDTSVDTTTRTGLRTIPHDVQGVEVKKKQLLFVIFLRRKEKQILRVKPKRCTNFSNLFWN